MLSVDRCRLYTFIDTAYLRDRDPAEVARQLCGGGADVIQLRAKGSTLDDTARLADAIAPIAERAGVPFVINDHLEIARRLSDPFVHLGQEDFFDASFTHVSQLEAGRVKPCSALRVGLSTHAPAQAERAVAAGADYIAIGPVFATDTKPGRAPVTLDYVRWAAANVRIPWFAIGGITLRNLDSVLAAGARRICVVSAILNAPDVTRACQQFKERLASAPVKL